MAFISRGTDRIFYVWYTSTAAGASHPLILIHGNVATHEVFAPMMAGLKQTRDVLVYDLRGFGQSDRGSEPLDWETYYEDLQFLMSQLGIEHCHLVGHGFGAIVALKYALLNADIVETLTLISLPFSMHAVSDAVQNHRRALSEGGATVPMAFIERVMTALPPGHPNRRWIVEPMSAATYARVMELSCAYEPFRDLGQLTVPTLVLAGEQDVVFPAYLSALACFYLPEYRFRVVPGAAYFVVVDQPQLTAEWITEFIRHPDGTPAARDPFVDDLYGAMKVYVRDVVEAGKERLEAADMLQVDLLRGFRVLVNGVEVRQGWNQRFAKSLLVYLVFHPLTTREQICDALWPEVPYTKSRPALRVYLSHLKRLLRTRQGNDVFLAADREHVQLLGQVHCDAYEVFQRIQEAVAEEAPDRRYRLTRQVVGMLDVDSAIPIYDDWFVGLRAQAEREIEALCTWAVDYLASRGRIRESAVYERVLEQLR
ncbi:MAG: alpha/beta fold hydrolase [Alicyclobacillus sp.]|nr:alpha/beta fold hydrolase [Alicyclobacillus sp.]